MRHNLAVEYLFCIIAVSSSLMLDKYFYITNKLNKIVKMCNKKKKFGVVTRIEPTIYRRKCLQ